MSLDAIGCGIKGGPTDFGKKGNIISGNDCNAQVGTSTCDDYFDQEAREDNSDVKGALGPHGLRRTNQK